MLMKHRDRVLAALHHEIADRPPFQATFTPEFADRLRIHFNLPQRKSEPHHREWYGYDLEIQTNQDALQVGVGWFTNYYLKDEPYFDSWGVKWNVESYETPYGRGLYTNIGEGPLSGVNPDVANYHAPDPTAKGLYDYVKRLVRDYKDEYYIIGRVHCTVFESAWALRGFEDMLIDMYVDPDRADQIFDITFSYHLEVALNMAKIGVDMIWLGDDMGTQSSLLMNINTWNKFLKPRYARICNEVKNINPNIKIAMHSDGCVSELIPGLIDIGVDVLNPIQTECMNPEELKKKYGANICFFGGIAVQSTLLSEKPESVSKEFHWLKNTLGKDGGWICAPTHHVQLDTPIENFLELMKCLD